jgi:DNA repair exonuclease SbcCD ATPase subunit
LKQAITDDVIVVAADPRTELIKIAMRSTNPEEAKQIVDAFIQAYYEIEVISSKTDENEQLTLLENERKHLEQKIKNYRDTLYRLGQEYGDVTLQGRQRQDVMLQRIGDLLRTLTKVEAERIELEAQVQLLERRKEQAIAPASEELLTKRKEYIDSDASIEALSERIADFEVDYVVSQSGQSAEDPELKRQAEVLDALKSHLRKRREEVGKTFDEMVSHHRTKAHEATLSETRVQLEQTREYEKRLRQTLSEQHTETIDVGRKQLTIQELQDKLESTKQRYDTVNKRYQDLELQQRRPTRISVHYNAEIASVRDSRLKYTIGVVLGVVVCGLLLVILGIASRRSSTPTS